MEPPPVQYVTTAKGVRIAYSVRGAGRPLVFLGPALGGMAHPWRFYPDWMAGLTERFSLIQHDMYGHGLSERGLPADYAVGDDDQAIDAILARLRLDRFLLYGLSGVGHAAVRYAAAHPERVEALILNGTVVSPGAPSFYQGVAAENWEFFLRSFVPASVGPEESQRWFEGVRDSTTYEDWRIRARVASESNVLDLLPRLRVPTLVLHARGLALTPPGGASRIAALIPDARLILLNGDNYMGDATEGLAAIEALLAGITAETEAAARGDAEPQVRLSARENEVLGLIARGLSNQLIADELVISLRTVERHINHIYEKIGVHSKAQATAYALQHRPATNA
ncbi:MAG TPA: alpha/beta fold hydrolase [Dehalococcoidia bacterium]|nr:alpha/beta fold hydrolase [Dehalococcoidia bacterium]